MFSTAGEPFFFFFVIVIILSEINFRPICKFPSGNDKRQRPSYYLDPNTDLTTTISSDRVLHRGIILLSRAPTATTPRTVYGYTLPGSHERFYLRPTFIVTCKTSDAARESYRIEK